MWNKHASNCAHINTIYIQKLFIETCQVEREQHSFYRLDLRSRCLTFLKMWMYLSWLLWSLQYHVFHSKTWKKQHRNMYAYHRGVRMVVGREARSDTRVCATLGHFSRRLKFLQTTACLAGRCLSPWIAYQMTQSRKGWCELLTQIWCQHVMQKFLLLRADIFTCVRDGARIPV